MAAARLPGVSGRSTAALSIFFNLANHADGQSRLTEQDVTLESGRSIGAWDVSGGWVGYFFTGGHGQSHEAFPSIALDAPLSPSLLIAHDFQQGDGTYLSAAVAQTWPSVVPRVELSSTFSIGDNNHQWTTASGLSDANIGRDSWR
jgi:hypothetical protein